MDLITFIIGFSIGVGLTIWLILWAALVYSREKITDITNEVIKEVKNEHVKRGL